MLPRMKQIPARSFSPRAALSGARSTARTAAVTSWVLAALLGASGSWAQSNTAAAGEAPTAVAGAKEYTPTRGQAGKDVIWIATPDAHVDRMLQLANAAPSDVLMDLGSGDGKIVIAAAKRGLRGHGVEYNADLVELSKRRAAQAGVQERTSFAKANLFDVDLSQASIITMYLLPELNLQLRPKLFTLKPGTRIVSHDFRMGKWQPDETSEVGMNKVHLWVIPANAGGMWEGALPTVGGEVKLRLHLTQTFQQVQGQALLPGVSTTLREVQLLGTQLRLAFTDEQGKLRRFEGQVGPTALEGTVDGQRLALRRVGEAPAIAGSGPVPPEDMEYIQ